MNTYNIQFSDDNDRTKSVEFVSSLSGKEVAAEIVRNAVITITDSQSGTTHVLPSDRVISVQEVG